MIPGITIIIIIRTEKNEGRFYAFGCWLEFEMHSNVEENKDKTKLN